MKHDWEVMGYPRVGLELNLHPLSRGRRCRACGVIQEHQTLYDFGSYSMRGGPKVRGYTWVPKVERCKG
jgi:hypothetical protein